MTAEEGGWVQSQPVPFDFSYPRGRIEGHIALTSGADESDDVAIGTWSL